MPRDAAMSSSPFGPPQTKRHVDRWHRLQKMFQRLEQASPRHAEGLLVTLEKYLVFHELNAQQTDDQKGGA